MSPLVSAIIIGGIVAGAAASAASGIKMLVDEQYPWDDPWGYTKNITMAGTVGGVTGAVTGGVGSALGGALGGMFGASTGATTGTAGSAPAVSAATNAAAAVESGGIGTGTGTVAANAGAALPQTLGGTVNSGAQALLGQTGGGQAAGGLIKEAIGRTAVGAGFGAATNPDDAGRGALIGGAGALASAGVQGLGNIAFQGSGAAFADTPYDATRGFPMANGGGDFARSVTGGYNPSAGYSPNGAPSAPSPGVGLQAAPRMGQFGTRAIGAGGKLAGQLASDQTRAALTPDPMQNPDPYANTPYGTRQGAYWTRF